MSLFWDTLINGVQCVKIIIQQLHTILKDEIFKSDSTFLHRKKFKLDLVLAIFKHCDLKQLPLLFWNLNVKVVHLSCNTQQTWYP